MKVHITSSEIKDVVVEIDLIFKIAIEVVYITPIMYVEVVSQWLEFNLYFQTAV